MNRIVWYALCLCLSLSLIALGVGFGKANDWSNSPNHAWYEQQQPTPETLKAYNILWKSCCAHGDVCQECVVHRYTNKAPYADGWWYTLNGVTKRLPDHIVDVVSFTQTGKPILFVAPFNSGDMKAGDPVCLKIISGGV